jgi:hypothetical protein
MATTRRRFEVNQSEEPDETLHQLESQIVMGEELVEEYHQEVVPEPEEEEEERPHEPEAPAAYLLALPGALLRKQDGTTEAVEAGTLLSTSGWVPLGEGLVAVNLGDRGKWTVLVSEWVVYFKG